MARLHRYLSTALIALMFLPPLVRGGDINNTGSLRALIMWGAGLGLVALVAMQLTGPRVQWGRVLTSLPDAILIVLLIWALISYFALAEPEGIARGIALAELLRISSCVVLYFGARYALVTRRQLSDVWLVILVGSSVVACAGILSADPAHKVLATAAFGNKELLSAFLVGLVPFAVFTTVGGPTTLHRRLAIVSLLLLVMVIILAGNRTSWLAGSIGSIIAMVLAIGVRGRGKRSPDLSRALRPLLWTGASISALIGILFLLNAGNMLRERTTPWAAHITVTSRFHLWRAAVQMIRQRPLVGWGIGGYPLNAARFGNGDVEFVPMQSVRSQGTSLATMAHDEPLQLAAELGLPALGLYLAVLGIYVLQAFVYVRRAAPGLRACFVAATLAAVISQAIDSLANPGWHFGEVAPMLWLMVGATMAAIRRTPLQRMKDSRGSGQIKTM